jgi:two-component system LytT family sensor kinase
VRAPDYRALLRELSEKLAQLRSEAEIADAVETAARQSLELKAAQLVTLENLSKTSLPTSTWPHLHGPEPDWLNAVNDGELVELECQHPYHEGHAEDEVELLVPVRSEGRVTHMIAISPGPARRGLVTHEVNYLRSVAEQCGHRRDALHMEERLIVAQSREAVLQQQVTGAELRALRAQINPHFLFNSLNSIANLVVTNPEQAETMTLRLARVFRHVLANSGRPLISLHEEIDFLETYLQIEKARFGSRLQVKIAVDPAVAMEQIPLDAIYRALQQHPLEQCHGLHHAEGHAHRASAGDSSRAGSETGSGERTPEESPPVGRAIDETDYFRVAYQPPAIPRKTMSIPQRLRRRPRLTP